MRSIRMSTLAAVGILASATWLTPARAGDSISLDYSGSSVIWTGTVLMSDAELARLKKRDREDKPAATQSQTQTTDSGWHPVLIPDSELRSRTEAPAPAATPAAPAAPSVDTPAAPAEEAPTTPEAPKPLATPDHQGSVAPSDVPLSPASPATDAQAAASTRPAAPAPVPANSDLLNEPESANAWQQTAILANALIASMAQDIKLQLGDTRLDNASITQSWRDSTINLRVSKSATGMSCDVEELTLGSGRKLIRMNGRLNTDRITLGDLRELLSFADGTMVNEVHLQVLAANVEEADELRDQFRRGGLADRINVAIDTESAKSMALAN